ncbi:MAG: hypothetical protein Fur0018_14570 [Anaerolineales bacterium]
MRRLLLLTLSILLLGLTVALVGGAFVRARAVTLHARMPENGGWSLDTLEASAGQPLRLHLVSDDVLHGFAIGQSETPEIVLYPGKTVETTLTFDQPGTYTYYCTRWCGPNHWRMRGTIVVTGDSPGVGNTLPEPPLYVTLGLDIDAPHRAETLPSAGMPSAERGQAVLDNLPQRVRTLAWYRTHSPAAAWQELRAYPSLASLSDAALWDAVAALWQQAAVPNLDEAARIYAQQCAACHGTRGKGDGPFAQSPSPHGLSDVTAPPDFGDPAFALGASPALWQGKILRGGMGTGMPSWGVIFTEAQTWALTDYLWTFSLLSPPR